MIRNVVRALALACLLACAFAGKSHAQNVICATAPAGSNDNRCASTAFVQNVFGTVVPVPHGGTGRSSLTADAILKGNGVDPIISAQVYIDSANYLGIQTATPSAPLTVNSTDPSTRIDIKRNNTLGMSLYTLPGSYAVVDAAAASTPLLFGINGIEKMRIDTAGNVGIGLSNPSAKLEISGGNTANLLQVDGRITQVLTNTFYGGKVDRLADRVFMGAATVNNGANTAPNVDWLSQLQLESYNGGPGVYGTPNYAQVSALYDIASPAAALATPQIALQAAIMSTAGTPIGATPRALEVIAVNDATNGVEIWGNYTEAHAVGGVGAGYTWANETEIRNSAQAFPVWTPYVPQPAGGAAVAYSVGCGAGLSATGQYNCTAAFYIGDNPMPFNAGIIVKAGGVAASGPGGEKPALSLAYDHALLWWASSASPAASIASDAGNNLNLVSNAGQVKVKSTAINQFIVQYDPANLAAINVSSGGIATFNTTARINLTPGAGDNFIVGGSGAAFLAYDSGGTKQGSFSHNGTDVLIDAGGTSPGVISFGKNLKLLGSTSGFVQIATPAVSGSNTWTLQAATDTFVGRATTDTLTNKSISGASNTLTNIDVASLSGLGAGIATWLATPSSANLRAAMTDETGTGALVFAGGNIGAATGTSLSVSGNLTSTAGNLLLTVGSIFVADNQGFYSAGATEAMSLDGTNHLMNFYTASTLRMRIAAGLMVGTTTDPGAGMIYTNSATYMIGSMTSYNNGAGANTATLTNAPATGNPTKWIPINDNGTVRYIPAW